VVATLPPDLQAAAREAYAVSLHGVFVLAACSTLLAFVVRLPVCVVFWMCTVFDPFYAYHHPQIPDKDLDEHKKTVGVPS